MVVDDMPSQLVYEEIRDVPAPLTMPPEAAVTRSVAAPKKTSSAATHHPYEDVEAAAAETGADSYHFTLCSAYGVSLNSKKTCDVPASQTTPSEATNTGLAAATTPWQCHAFHMKTWRLHHQTTAETGTDHFTQWSVTGLDYQ